MLCPILIGPLFYQGFHTRDGLDFLLAHGRGPVRPVRPRLLFLSSSVGNVGLYSMDIEIRKALFKNIQVKSFAGHLRVSQVVK